MEGRPSAPEGVKRKDGEIGEGSWRHPAGYAEKQPSPCYHQRPNPTKGWAMAAGGEEEKNEKKEGKRGS